MNLGSFGYLCSARRARHPRPRGTARQRRRTVQRRMQAARKAVHWWARQGVVVDRLIETYGAGLAEQVGLRPEDLARNPFRAVAEGCASLYDAGQRDPNVVDLWCAWSDLVRRATWPR